MSTRALIYCRISQDRAGAGLGVERQAADCRELADRLGWTVVGTYTDNDTSAYTGRRRKGYEALLDALEAGDATGVLVWHTDRLHRSPVELERYATVCENHGVVTQTVKAGELDLSTPSGRLVARQLGAVARYEVEHNVERIKAARLQAVEAGKWTGGRRPFGYEADGVTVREDEARWVRHAVDEVLAGVPLSRIARELNAAGLTGTSGSPWTGSSVRRVVQRPRNAGLIVHNGKEAGRAEWPALVDEDRWRGAVAILADPGRRTNRGAPLRYLGSGRYLCGLCGSSMNSTSNGKQRHYTCLPSQHVARAAGPVDELVEAVLIERLRQPDAAALFAPATPDTSALHTDAQAVRERLQELARLYAEGTVDARQLAEGTTRLRERLADLEGRIAAAATDQTLAPFAGRDPAQVWAELDVDRRRAVLSALATVTLLPSPKGRPHGWKPGQSYLRPETVRIEWKAG